jgi:hypothetical protein
MTLSSFARMAALAISLATPALCLARDEHYSERITGDDDPIMLPRTAMPEVASSELQQREFFDPDTTGSTVRARAEKRCERVAWFPDRAPEDQFRPAC